MIESKTIKNCYLQVEDTIYHIKKSKAKNLNVINTLIPRNEKELIELRQKLIYYNKELTKIIKDLNKLMNEIEQTNK